MSEELAKHLSFFVPAGFVLTKQSEIDRLHNEAEALRIERDAAREENEALHTANELQVAERRRLLAYADGETDTLRRTLGMVDEFDSALRQIAQHEVPIDVEDIKYCQASAYHDFRNIARGALERGGDPRAEVERWQDAYRRAREGGWKAEVDRLREVLEEIAGDYGCGLREPADQSEPPRPIEACRNEWPDTRSKWCVLCLASDALGR